MNEFTFDIQRFDDINNTVDGASVVGTTGNDVITNTGANVTINALTGDDSINVNDYSASASIQYAAGDGNDTITGYTSEDGSFNYRLQITGSAYSSAISGSSVILGVGNNSITIEDAMLTSTEVKGINIVGSYRDSLGNIANSNASVNVYGTSDADSIVNKGQGVTIHALGGDDTINNEAGSNVYIDAGTGSNEIYNEGGTTGVTIQGSDSADTISNINGAGASINGGGGNDTILSETGNDVSIYGGDGADTISADGARVYVNGEAGADSIISNGINGTTVFGGDGKDTIKNTGYSVYIYGDEDDDVIDNTNGSRAYYGETSNQLNSAVSIYGGVGADSIKNDGNNVLVEGGDGADTIVNESYLVSVTTDGVIYDHYEGGQGTTLNGGEGNDYISNDAAQVTIEGGAGSDTISLDSNSASVVIQYNGDDGNDSVIGFKASDSLKIGDGTGTYSAQTVSNDVIIASYGASLTLSGASSLDTVNVIGTKVNDSTDTGIIYNDADNTLVAGTNNADTISNLGDNVTIQALGGNDSILNTSSYTSILAGEGDDYVNNGPGVASAAGGNLSNLLVYDINYADVGELSNVTIDAGDGKDTIINAVSNSVVDGGVGDDSIINSANNVTISGGAGNDYIQGAVKGKENIVIDAGDGNNEIETYGTNVSITTGTGNDSINVKADSEQVTVTAGAGDDTILNTATDSFIDAGAGKDFIHNDLGNVTIDAGAEDDVIEAYGSNVSINGGAGADKITVNSIEGVTTVTGGSGDDTITRSSGNVLLQYSSGDGNDVLVGFTASDTLVIGSGTGTYSSSIEGNDLVLTVGEQTIKMTNAATITPNINGISSGGSTVLGGTKNGTSGDDDLSTTEYDIATARTTIYTALNGLAGNDRLNNNSAIENVTLDGGAGNDYIDNRGANSSLVGGAGDDYISNSNGSVSKVDNPTIDGGAGADVVYNWGDNALINLGDGNDSVYSRGVKATIDGGEGDDTISSYGDNSSITGGNGADNITGSGSNLTIQSGVGNDTVTFGGGSDTIYSGVLAEDTAGSNTYHAEYVKDSSIKSGAGNDSVYTYQTENVAITLGAGANSLTSNYDKNTTITAGDGKDILKIYDGSQMNIDLGAGHNELEITNINDSTASGYTINTGTGNDTINIDANNALINAGDGDNSIISGGYEAGNNVTINTGSGADYIYNYYNSVYGSGRQENVVINSGAGNDTINNSGNKATINGGDGNDEIQSYDGEDYLINGDAGNDTIFGAKGTLNGGEGNDSISGNNATISGGAGNDTIRAGENVLVQYASGDGDDFIEEFNSSTTLSIGGTGTYSTVKSGDNVIVTVGNGIITLGNAASLDNLNIIGDTSTVGVSINSSLSNTLLSGTDYDDFIYNSGDKVTIQGFAGSDTVRNGGDVASSGGHQSKIDLGDGDDSIYNYAADSVSIDTGAGDDDINLQYGNYVYLTTGDGKDSVYSRTSPYVTIDAGDGDDYISSNSIYGSIVAGAGNDFVTVDANEYTVDGGEGKDTLSIAGYTVSADGGDGDDTIINNAFNATIKGGTGNDTITNSMILGTVYQYTAGDGNDVINGFTASDTLFVTSGNYSTTVSGNDVVVTVGDGNVTVQGAANLETLNIVGDSSNDEAKGFITALEKKTEYGYPVIAALFFHPEEYHGFDTLPSSYYVESETLTINSSDGLELTGFHYTPENPDDKWVILVHGYGHNHRHMNGFAQQYLTNNYHVLMIDQRAAGESEGEWLTMSAGESEDLVLWTHKVAELNPNAKITLHGVSMGAATAMLAAANSGLTNVTSLIEDCGYTSVLKLVDIVKSAYPALGDPAFVDLVDKTSGSLTGYTLSEASPIDSIGSATMPSMFITGTSDVVVSMSMLESLYAASGAEVKEIFTVAGATHGVSALTDSIGYANTVFRFNAEAAGEGWITSNVTDNISLRGTKYDDTITTSGSNVTLNTGEGNDTINNSGSAVIHYNSGDGSDVINGFTASDTLVVGTSYATQTSGDDVVVMVSDGSITLNDAASLSALNIVGAGSINNTVDNTLIAGTPYDDLIYNTGSNVTIQGLAGNDTINNINNDKTFIDAGDGDDLITNNLAYEIVTLASGEETLVNPYSDTTIVAGAGDDRLNIIGGNQVSASAGEGNDSIFSFHSYYKTVDGGAGNDFINISEGHHENIYGGDGNDSIIGTILFETLKGDWAMGGYAQIDGGAGADYVSVGYSNNSTITGGDGADTIITYGPNSEVFGGDGNDSIALISNSETTLTSAGTTITGGAGDDTITSDGSGVVVKYSAGDGNDVITGLSASDTVLIDSAYKSSVSGNDVVITVAGSDNTLTLKNAASIQPNMSVAIIAQGNDTYAYTSIAEAATNADNGSNVTVIADSTETSEIDSTKNLTIQFAESDTSVYNVSGGNFVSATDFEGFAVDSLVSAGGNILSIAEGSTATFNGYEITGNANGYTFALQSNVAPINGIEFNGAGTASFDTDGNISLTSGAVATMADSDAATFNLGAGSYTLNGNTVSAAAATAITVDSDTSQFVVTSDSISYNAFTFSGSGAASVANDLPTLTAGVAVERDGRDMVVLTEKGQNTINGRGFEMTEGISEGITVGAVDNGIGAAHIIPYESFPEDAGKLFAEEALIYGDDSYTVRLNKDGIKSIYGLSAGSTIRGTAYLDGEVDTLGSILQLAVDSPGVYNLANKAYTLSGAIDSENVVALSSRFYTDNTAALKNVYYLNGMISGDFSSAVTINNAPMDVQVLGDTNVSVYATDSVKPAADANSSVISSSGNATSITGVGNGSSIISAGGATKVSTNEEGVFTFRSDADTQQGFTVTGDDSVDFILQNYTDENGNATMQVAGVNNFENGFYTISKDSAYHAINAGENIAAGDELVIGFADTATFVIADSKVVSVNGVDYSINRLKGDVDVHAANAVTVNGVLINVKDDNDFNVIVSDSKVTELVNISAGASVSVESVDIVTDNSGEFKIGEYVYNLDVDGGVTFTTDSNGAVKNISGVTGMLNTSANNITLNGAAFTTTNTDITITAADDDIAWVEGLASGDSISGELDSATVVIPANADSDTVEVTINSRGYTLNDDSTGIQITNDFISGLDSGARLQISAAGTYNVNGTTLRTKVGDTIVGTAEGSAYIYDPNNIPLNTNTMSNDEISAQVGIPASYADVETNTNVAGAEVANGGASTMNGSMALALDNTGSNVEQTADFSNATGRKRVTLEGGDQAVKFNNEGRNVAVIEGGATGEKNVSLGGGGDLAIVRDTSTPVNVTTGAGKDTVVTSGGDVFVEMGSGAAKLVPNSGNATLNHYNAATGAGIQLNEFADLTRAIMSGNIALEIGAITFNDIHVRFGAEDETSSIVNLFNNEGKKQKVAYTNGDGGVADLSGEREAVMFVGNTGGNTSLTGGSGNDTAIGGAGDYIDLGAGNNYIALDDNTGATQGAVVGFTAREGKTEVDGFNNGFSDNADRVSIDISIGQVRFDGVNMTFTNGGGTMILKNIGGASDLAESAYLIEDNNFIAGYNFISGTTLDEITPITYEQGDYQNLYDATFAKAQDTISAVTFAKG